MAVPDLVSRIRLLFDDSGVNRATTAVRGFDAQVTGTARKSTTATTAVSGGFEKAAGAVTALGGAVGLVAGSAIARGLGSAIEAASALEEQVNAVTVTFGAAAGKVLAFGETTASTFGISNRAALEGASIFGAFFQQTGLAEDEVADLSKSVVALAGDLSSLRNTSTEQALGALRSGLSGEADALKGYAIFINEATVKAEAYRSGIAEVGSELTEGQKVLARWNLIVQQSNTAQGDAIRTADSYAGTQRRLAAEREDALGRFGKRLKDLAGDAAVVAESALVRLTDTSGSLVDQLERGANIELDRGIGGFLRSLVSGADETGKANAKAAQSYREVRGEAAARVRQLAEEQQAEKDRAAAVEKAPQARVDVLGSNLAERRSLLDLQQAQQALADVTEESARARERAAERVANAQKALADAHRDATSSFGALANAQRALGTAEANLARSHDRVKEAQKQLTEARRDAVRALQDLHERSSDLERDERRARRRVDEARNNIGRAKTPQEEADALLDLEEAEDALSDIQRDRTRTAEDLAEADAKGVDGAPNVVAAQQQVKDAIQGVADATFQVAQASNDLARVQEEVGNRIVTAQKETAQAIRDAQTVARDEGLKTQLAQLTLEGVILAVAAAAQKSAADIAAAAGGSVTAAGQYDVFRQRLVDLAAQSDGPTKQALLDLIARLDAVKSPPPVAVTAETREAHEALKRLRDDSVGGGDFPVRAHTAEAHAALKRLRDDIVGGGDFSVIPGVPGVPYRREHGGPVRAGYPYIVGERRPELFVPDVNGMVLPSVPRGGGTESLVVNQYVNDEMSRFGRVVAQRDLKEAVREGLKDLAWGA